MTLLANTPDFRTTATDDEAFFSALVEAARARMEGIAPSADAQRIAATFGERDAAQVNGHQIVLDEAG